jgi:type I restriction enzyme R subunit
MNNERRIVKGAATLPYGLPVDGLPENPYPQELWDAKVNQVWDFVTRRYA